MEIPRTFDTKKLPYSSSDSGGRESRVVGVAEVEEEAIEEVGGHADDADITEDDEEDEGKVERGEETRH